MPKHVLMIVYNYYPSDPRVRREAETLAALCEYDITVISLKDPHKPKKRKVDNVTIIETHQSKYDKNSKIKYIFSYLKFFAFCFVFCTKKLVLNEIDVVHIHNMPDLLVFAALIPKLFKRKLVLDIHDSMPETYADKFTKTSSLIFKALCWEEYISALFADRIICVNHPQKKTLVQRGIPETKIDISMNVPDSKWFDCNLPKITNKRSNGAFKMIYHGTIARRLGVDLILKAIAHLENKIANLEFHIWAKDSHQLDELEALSYNLKIRDKIHLLRGGMPFEMLPIELSKMDLGIIGNRKGIATDLMLPTKMLEYIAVGIPVVAPRLKCIQHYFSKDMIAYYDPDDIDSMGDAILSLYNSESRRETQVRKASIFLERYGWEKHKHDLLNMYKEL